MPVGVPRVAFRVPGDENASWVDLFNGLFRARSVFLGQELNEEGGNDIASLMIFLALENPKKSIYFFLNSPGGLALAGLAISDTMDFVTPDVYTLGLGLVASMASFLLACGTPGKRRASDHMRAMIHQPSSKFLNEAALNLEFSRRELQSIRDIVIKTYVEKTGQDARVIKEDLRRDSFMSATESKDYGLVDDVGFKGISADIRKENPFQNNSTNPVPPEAIQPDNSFICNHFRRWEKVQPDSSFICNHCKWWEKCPFLKRYIDHCKWWEKCPFLKRYSDQCKGWEKCPFLKRYSDHCKGWEKCPFLKRYSDHCKGWEKCPFLKRYIDHCKWWEKCPFLKRYSDQCKGWEKCPFLKRYKEKLERALTLPDAKPGQNPEIPRENRPAKNPRKIREIPFAPKAEPDENPEN
uniref:ATP-dependent Clp protease proteolytic subunit n=1 Tax=Oenothera macrocarpa TaxID=260701 RepID=B0LP81_9MYRT